MCDLFVCVLMSHVVNTLIGCGWWLVGRSNRGQSGMVSRQSC